VIATGPNWTLHLGDCIEGMRTLADDSVDVTITDPPYEAEAHTLGRRQKGKGTIPGTYDEAFREVSDSSLPFAAITASQRAAVAIEIARVTRHRAIVFCQAEAVGDWRDAFNAAGMPYRRSMPWNKPDAMPSLHGRWPGQAYESIVLAMHSSAPSCPIGGKSKRYSCTRARPGSPGGPASAKAPHPTTKPLTLMLELVEDFTVPGDLVLDPFSGSATTGVAATRVGRRFLGWELNRDYHEIACRRLRGEEARPNPAQPSLFGGAA
jgi:site-specific DNA-methyltransferase (adenine-specific)